MKYPSPPASAVLLRQQLAGSLRSLRVAELEGRWDTARNMRDRIDALLEQWPQTATPKADSAPVIP